MLHSGQQGVAQLPLGDGLSKGADGGAAVRSQDRLPQAEGDRR